MPGDKVLSQAEIDALVSNVPQKPSPPPGAPRVAPAVKPSATSSPAEIGALVSNVPQKPVPPPVTTRIAPASKPSVSSPPPAKTEYDSLPARLARLESNYAITKKELQALLLDLREKSLENENPFNVPNAAPSHPPADTRKT